MERLLGPPGGVLVHGLGTLWRPFEPWVATRWSWEQSIKSFLLAEGMYIAMISDAGEHIVKLET